MTEALFLIESGMGIFRTDRSMVVTVSNTARREEDC